MESFPVSDVLLPKMPPLPEFSPNPKFWNCAKPDKVDIKSNMEMTTALCTTDSIV